MLSLLSGLDREVSDPRPHGYHQIEEDIGECMNADAEISIVREMYASYLLRYEWDIRPTQSLFSFLVLLFPFPFSLFSFLSHAIRFGDRGTNQLLGPIRHRQ